MLGTGGVFYMFGRGGGGQSPFAFIHCLKFFICCAAAFFIIPKAARIELCSMTLCPQIKATLL